MWFHKGHNLERSRSYCKINGTIRFLDHTNIDPRHQNRHPKCLVQTLWRKTSFCIMVANINLRTFHVQRAQNVFDCLKGPYLSYLLVNFGNFFAINNQDMSQNDLGCTISSNARIDGEIDNKLAKANCAFGRLYKHVWNNKHLRSKRKISVYRAVVLTTLLYGSES